jgi:poly(3-hydroxybutyrate) depolymerase
MKTCGHIAVVILACGGFAAGAAEPAVIRPARDSLAFAQAGHRVKVWYYAPAGLPPNAPVVIVQHGVGRNGEDYLNDWVPHAERERFLLVVPEFSKAEFPGVEGYNYGNTVDSAGRPRPREEWSFSMIEPIFDAMRRHTGNQSSTYLLFGHSAGAQFVQRFLYFVPQARVARAVAANAGWYMLPDPAVEFPYGLKGTPVTEADLRNALARPFTVLLGDADTDPEARSLRHTPEADAQGLYRFARGQYFFNFARAAAATLKTPLGWSLATAPGIDHSDQGMAPFAVPHLLPVSTPTNNP